ncbi:hypothetical protein L0657_26190 [Dyadobacter sp. CY345]|uniref:hypothetical protein n=1 Tax=Dyadobacter sp. CY345 TaxID=2909335 RepID=UPI001F3289C2|nr:hypothetical protein [Dyadobacter sp. CY345]MCF2447472.1 hypothetical protein [Dyadobacter sp. CY345]
METIPKNVLIESLKTMPDNLEVEQVIEQIILLSKIERSRKQLDSGAFQMHDDVKNAYKKWLE